MMHKFSVRLLSAACAVAVAAAAPAQQFVDGGFEGTNPNGPTSFTGYQTGTTLGGGSFTVVGPAGTVGTVLAIGSAYSETRIQFNTAPGIGGSVAIDLTGSNGTSPGNVGVGSGVQQTLSGLTVGQAYTLSFQVGRAISDTNSDYSAAASNDAVVGVSVTGGAAFSTTVTNSDTTNGTINGPSIGGQVNYQQFDFTITPTTAADVTFAFTNQLATASFIGLDNVSLTPVPEPTTVGLLATAGLGLAGLVRRRFC